MKYATRPAPHLWVMLAILLSSHSVVEGAERQSSGKSPIETDSIGASLVGKWEGNGNVYGKRVTLSREWSSDLGGKFTKADMLVKMSNGNLFRAVLYLKASGSGAYSLTWLDEAGTMKTFDALGDQKTRTLTYYSLDHGDDGVLRWQRGVYRILSSDKYEEILDAEVSGAWKTLARFEFTRSSR